ncbi:hypothetical protein Ahy_B03g065579 [Arachis hypogaea]|uniref:Acyl-ACP thioesterase-like C-terminal domain-containing protein n=1 Tax=Arachis hypogaea TaxID=3818 RepID=A0A445A260_ARAHY|nr:hypothetical protein Ahy_B03g065579 [Arachis hypogaea]
MGNSVQTIKRFGLSSISSVSECWNVWVEVSLEFSGVCVIMNKLTRKLSRIPEEVRREICFVNSTLILEDGYKILPKLDDTTADYICSSLKPRWSDIDVNLHVNNVKYIGWILEKLPLTIDNWELH